MQWQLPAARANRHIRREAVLRDHASKPMFRLFDVCNLGMQVYGGYGFIKEFPVERMYRDVKGIEFGAGTTQIQKLIIARELLKQMAGG